MTIVSTNNNKLDNHPIAKLVFGNLAGTDQDNNRTLLGTARVCTAWQQNPDMMQARRVAAMNISLSRHQIGMGSTFATIQFRVPALLPDTTSMHQSFVLSRDLQNALLEWESANPDNKETKQP